MQELPDWPDEGEHGVLHGHPGHRDEGLLLAQVQEPPKRPHRPRGTLCPGSGKSANYVSQNVEEPNIQILSTG